MVHNYINYVTCRYNICPCNCLSIYVCMYLNLIIYLFPSGIFIEMKLPIKYDIRELVLKTYISK